MEKTVTQFKSLKPLEAHVYTMPFAQYNKLPKAALKQLYDDYIILGVREWATKGHLVLIKKGSNPDYE